MDNKNIGWILISIGGAIVLWAFFIFDTTVAVDAYMRVNNLGLLNDQRNYSMLGGFVAVVGIFFLLRTESKDTQVKDMKEKPKNQPISSPRIINQGFSGNKSIDNDAYKIFLVKKYSIEKNVALDKFIVGERLFNSIEEALIYASGMDESSTTSPSQNISTKNVKTQNTNITADFPEIIGDLNYKKITIKDTDCMHFYNDTYGFFIKNVCYVYESKAAVNMAITNYKDYGQIYTMGLIQKINSN
jgi:hypothetical protein